MQTAFILIGMILAVGVFYVLVPVVLSAYRQARSGAMTRCPETGQAAALQLDSRHAAWTAAFGIPRQRVENCSLWPERRDCRQRCLRTLN